MKAARPKPQETYAALRSLRFLEEEAYLRAFIEWQDPDNIDAQYRYLLPRDAVVATRTPLLQHSNSEIWFQLFEGDRRTFRAVYFHVKAAAYAKRGDPCDITQNMLEAERLATEKIIVRDWLRWLAVKRAKAERRPDSKRRLSYKDGIQSGQQAAERHRRPRCMVEHEEVVCEDSPRPEAPARPDLISKNPLQSGLVHTRIRTGCTGTPKSFPACTQAIWLTG